MRLPLILVTALIAGGIGVSLVPGNAAAAPPPGIAAAKVAPGTIETVGYWRRYYRRYGYGPDVVPDVEVDVPPVVVEETPVLNEPRVMIVPVRPVSCGEYRYWDGDRCVDARYNNPYLGPR